MPPCKVYLVSFCGRNEYVSVPRVKWGKVMSYLVVYPTPCTALVSFQQKEHLAGPR